MRGEAAFDCGHQRFELAVFLHYHHALADRPDGIEIGGNAAPIVGAVQPLALTVNDLAGDDPRSARLPEHMHFFRRQRAAFYQVAIILDAANGIERQLAVGNRRHLLADHRFGP